VTTGRYQDVTVDPETLQVRVRLTDGTLHAAGLLSHGTTEQVYLLLRMAMAERLVAGEESCPLLLDDVTVHCDPGRTQAILDLLARVAEDRQVVLFTQEADVVAWASENLTDDRHRIVSLDRPAVPA
jgi:DNA repair protein SbcC/Rad50